MTAAASMPSLLAMAEEAGGTEAPIYSELRGWKIHHLDEQDASLDAGEGVAYLSIQRNRDYVRPTWPGAEGGSR